MKNIIFKCLRNILLITTITISYQSIAQGPPPPPNGGNTGSNQNGGNAPIGGGLFILLGLGAVYGGKKVYNLYQKGLENLEE